MKWPLIHKHESLKVESVSSWRSVAVSVCFSFILVSFTGLVLSVLAPRDYARSGLLFFRHDEAFGFFIIAFLCLMVGSRKRPNWRLERVFFRLIASITCISALSVLISLSTREFAQFFLIGFACFIFPWAFCGRFLREALICLSTVVALLVSPVDIIFSSPMRSTDGRQASVQLLDAQYGLMREPVPGTFSMGCLVPPNPVAWVLWIDLWPIVDQAFRTSGAFFEVEGRFSN